MIYFIRVIGTNVVKIGRALDVKSRFNSIASGNHMPLELCITLRHRCDSDKSVEQELHEKIQDRRIRGEWFDLPLEVILSLLKDFAPRSFVGRNYHGDVWITSAEYTIENHVPTKIAFGSCEYGSKEESIHNRRGVSG